MLIIRKALETDWEEIWPIVHNILKKGDTYAYPPETDKKKGRQIWMTSTTATYVATWNEKIIGTYFIKPNQPGLGSHVCNAGYMVSNMSRGEGIGRKMCAHSLNEARKLGFSAMQYNLVVVTNVYAIRLWKDMGFEIVGKLRKAFCHKQKGFLDAYVMYRLL